MLPNRRPASVAARPIAADPNPTASLYSVRLRDIWRFVKAQPLSFWAINFYLFFEYVRPQDLYGQINVLPWTRVAMITAAVAWAMESFRFRKLYPADWMLLGFCAIVLLSSVFAVYPQKSQEGLFLFFSWIIIYAFITNSITSEQRWLVFVLLFMLYSTKMSQHGARTFAERGGSFASWGATGGSTWFRNSGEFGIQMCIFFPLSLYFIQSLRRYWPKWKLIIFLFMPVSALISIIASSSRGAVLGLIPVVMWMLFKSRYRAKAFTLAAFLSVGIWFLLPEQQKERFSSMGEDDTSQSRLVYWKRGIEMMNEYPITGIGYANWLQYSTDNYPPLYGKGGRAMVQVSHNIFIEAGSELGYTGLFLFIGLIGMTLYTNHRTRKLARLRSDGLSFPVAMSHGLDAAMMGFLAGGFFVTVLYYPFFWINYAMTVALHHSVASGAKKTVSRPARGLTPRPSLGGRTA